MPYLFVATDARNELDIQFRWCQDFSLPLPQCSSAFLVAQ